MPISKIVSKYTLDGKYIQSYVSVRLAGKANNIKHQHISRVLTGKRKATGGFIWRYANSQEFNQ